jgi:phosphoribosyl-ATP pyrophosphohydrolase
MDARLTKAKGEHRRVMRAAAAQLELKRLAEAEAGAVRIAPAEIETNAAAAEHEVDRLYTALSAVAPDEHPRTARLLAASTRKVAQKVIEEAGEVALAAVKHNNNGIVRESADLLYHLVVLWRRAGIDSATIWAEMRRRADTLGIAEKLPKSAA